MAERKPIGNVTIAGLEFPYGKMTISQMADAEPVIKRQASLPKDATLREILGPLIDLLHVMLSRFTPDLTVEEIWEFETTASELQGAAMTIMQASGYVRKGGSPGEAQAPGSSTSTKSTARSLQAAGTRRKS